MKKISVSLSGHQTSISLENEFFDVLQNLAQARKTSITAIIKSIDETRKPNTNLSSETRIWILKELLRTTKSASYTNHAQ